MDVNVRKVVSNIMEKMHQVTCYLMQLEKYEIADGKISEDLASDCENIKKLYGDCKDPKMIFSSIQTEYRKLEQLLVSNAQMENKMMYGLFDNYDENEIEEDKILTFIREKLVDEDETNSLSSRITEITDYIRISYGNLKYITQVDESGEVVVRSIYEGTPFENLVAAEAYLQIANLSILEKRIKSKRDPDIYTFIDKANILYNMSLEEFCDKHAIKTINSNIEYIKNCKDQYEEKEYSEIISKLYEQKYIHFFTSMNYKYNGFIQENDVGKFKCARKSMEEGSIGQLLGMPDFEVEQNKKSNIVDLRKELKFEIKEIISRSTIEEKVKKYLENRFKGIKNEDQKDEIIKDEK